MLKGISTVSFGKTYWRIVPELRKFEKTKIWHTFFTLAKNLGIASGNPKGIYKRYLKKSKMAENLGIASGHPNGIYNPEQDNNEDS